MSSTVGWIVYGDSCTVVLDKTSKGWARLRILKGERVFEALVPPTDLREALDCLIRAEPS